MNARRALVLDAQAARGAAAGGRGEHEGGLPRGPDRAPGPFILSDDGLHLALEELQPGGKPKAIVLVVSGVTGVNPEGERPITGRLRDAGYGVITLDPRGTGRSEGRRGDVPDFERYLRDFEIAAARARSRFPRAPLVLFGHSMGGAFALELMARARGGIAGVVLVNPAYKRRSAKGMTPRLRDYLRYAAFYLFARGKPIVDMGGDPALIQDPSDREEAEARRRDERIVPVQSMRTMVGAKRIMDRSAANAARIEAPLFLIEGALDALIDPEGSREIYEAWKGRDRERFVAPGAGHGRRATLDALEAMIAWLDRHFAGPAAAGSVDSSDCMRSATQAGSPNAGEIAQIR